MKLVVANGLQATPMSAVAKAAGTGMGTIYHYFTTKEDLINAVYLYIKQSEINQLFENIDPNISVKAKFLQLYTALIHFYLKHPESFAFMDQMQNAPVIYESTKQKGITSFEPVIQLIAQGQSEGIIKNIDIMSVLYFLAGTLNTYIRWILSVGKRKNKQYLEQHLRMVWDAVKE